MEKKGFKLGEQFTKLRDGELREDYARGLGKML
jgi:hypothetical protein